MCLCRNDCYFRGPHVASKRPTDLSSPACSPRGSSYSHGMSAHSTGCQVRTLLLLSIQNCGQLLKRWSRRYVSVSQRLLLPSATHGTQICAVLHVHHGEVAVPPACLHTAQGAMSELCPCCLFSVAVQCCDQLLNGGPAGRCLCPQYYYFRRPHAARKRPTVLCSPAFLPQGSSRSRLRSAGGIHRIIRL